MHPTISIRAQHRDRKKMTHWLHFLGKYDFFILLSKGSPQDLHKIRARIANKLKSRPTMSSLRAKGEMKSEYR